MEYLTISDICSILKIGKTKAYELVERKDFPKIKIGKCIRIPKEQFEIYMKHCLYKVL